MKRLKQIILRVFDLPVWLSILIAVPSFALLIYVMAMGMENSALAYISYPLSAYALALVCTASVRIARHAQRGFEDVPLIRRALAHPMGRRMRSDELFRAEAMLYTGLFINLLYTAIKMISGIVYHSLWFGALAGYYLLLSVLRFALVLYVLRNPMGQNPVSEWKRYRLCGAVLLVMNQALGVVVFLVVRRNEHFQYPGFLIYAMAAYAFYAVINAIRNVVKFRKHASPVLSAAKVVTLVAALVSMLSLETAMLAQFGDASDEFFRRLMTGCTGAAVCAVVLAMAVYMIVVSTKQIKRLRKAQ